MKSQDYIPDFHGLPAIRQIIQRHANSGETIEQEAAEEAEARRQRPAR